MLEGTLPSTAVLPLQGWGHQGPEWESDQVDTQGGTVWVSTRIQVFPFPVQHLCSDPTLPPKDAKHFKPAAAQHAVGWSQGMSHPEAVEQWMRTPVHGAAVTCIHSFMQNSHYSLAHCPASEDANEVSHLEKQPGSA